MNALPEVSVIVPTRAAAERAELIQRALASILAQEGVRAVPVVVVNGPESAGRVARDLGADPALRVITRPAADLPAALRAGREFVDTPWFAELDDDDLLLPGALRLRVAAARDGDGADVIVTNGIRRGPGGDAVHIPDPATVRGDPLRALLKRNWLLPGSWLCRTEAIAPEFFAGMPRNLECTYLGLRFGALPRFRYLDEATVVWHTASPGSVSHSRGYVLGQPAALRRLLALPLPADVRAVLRSRIPTACGDALERCLSEGAITEALGWQLRAIGNPDAWRRPTHIRRMAGAWWRHVRG